ncbi:sugar phosphate isomerase/epimerase family protein [Amnibacterium endophyticum]|uniref:Sugar phosphate isomerase/epimerase family protein n=1 Tax=Amnibacterium endophyticum TaxID=2109337 RepID=A0ABW4LFT0_9MICO
MPRGPLSVQLYSIRDAIAEDLPGSLARIREIGLEGVEPYGFVERATDYRAALDAAGLVAPSAHAPVLKMDDPRRAFDAAKEIGVDFLIDPSTDPQRWTSASGVSELAQQVNETAALAAEAGLTFGYHNHWWELENAVGPVPALEAFAAQLDPAVILEVDTYWVEVGGASAVDVLAHLGERVRFIHVKDGPRTRETEAQLPAGQGSMDIPAVLNAAPGAVRVLEFDAYRGDVFEGLAESMAYVLATDERAEQAGSAD